MMIMDEKKNKVSAAKRRANDAWDKANMAMLACKIRKDAAERFKDYAAAQGTTVNALLRGYIMQCIGDDPTSGSRG